MEKINRGLAARPIQIAIIGGGPAGLKAAETLSAVDGLNITVFEAMPSVGRKFLMAGKGGLNITHAEPYVEFIKRYRGRESVVKPWLDALPPEDLRQWIHGLGIETFVGTSGRVFPKEMKAAPLLRAWLRRLRENRVEFAVRHRWLGWNASGELLFSSPEGTQTRTADALILALGGASWPQLGSDGRWQALLGERGIVLKPFEPSNCGFEVNWSPHFRQRFAGAAVKTVRASCGQQQRKGDFNITEHGIEGGLIYALSAELREMCQQGGEGRLILDLQPDRPLDRLTEALARPRGRDSLANHLRRYAGLDGVKAGLLREVLSPEQLAVPETLAHTIKHLVLPIGNPRPIEEAISSAGGVDFSGLDQHLMLKRLPGVFCAGEMLDWDAPTGGYLLTACLASGQHAARGLIAWLNENYAFDTRID